MIAEKLTAKNHIKKLKTSDDAIPVRAIFYNELYDDVSDVEDTADSLDTRITTLEGTITAGKYSDTINLILGTTTVVTTLTTIPYSIMILDSSGYIIDHTLYIKVYLDAEVYKLDIDSAEVLNNAKLYITY